MHKRIIFITLYFLLINYSCFAQSDAEAATKYYNSGVEFFKQGKYQLADSFFTLSLNKYRAVDAFFNRAVTRKKIGNVEGYCNDIYMATANGDKVARDAFLKECTMNDTTYFDGKIRIMAQHKFGTIKDSIIVDSLGRKFWFNAVNPVRDSLDDTLAIYTETMPVFPGGDIGLVKFLTMNVKYPHKALEDGIVGTVYVTFTLSKEGNAEDIKILRGVSEELDKEALRVVSMMPQWFPGTQNGRFVKVQYNIPVKFKIK